MAENRILAPTRNSKISHLKENELQELINEYYNGTKNNVLSKKFFIKTNGNLIALFPPTILDKECIYCNVRLWKKLESRNLSNHNTSINGAYCPSCGHIEGNKFCSCENCLLEYKRKETEKRDRERSRFNEIFNNSTLDPIPLNELNAEEKVFLGVLIKTGLSDNKLYIKINQDIVSPLTPSSSFLEEMILGLLKKKLIAIHPETKYQSFSGISDFGNFNIDYIRAYYHVNVKDFNSEKVLNELIKPQINIKEHSADIIGIWRKIAKEECRAYLNYCLIYVDFPIISNEQTEKTFEQFWEHFSISQIFGLLNRCLGYTTKEFQAGKLTKANSGAYLLRAFQNQGEKAIANNWALSSYFRPKELVESAFSKYFFVEILELKDGGFYTKPAQYFAELKAIQ